MTKQWTTGFRPSNCLFAVAIVLLGGWSTWAQSVPLPSEIWEAQKSPTPTVNDDAIDRGPPIDSDPSLVRDAEKLQTIIDQDNSIAIEFEVDANLLYADEKAANVRLAERQVRLVWCFPRSNSRRIRQRPGAGVINACAW